MQLETICCGIMLGSWASVIICLYISLTLPSDVLGSTGIRLGKTEFKYRYSHECPEPIENGWNVTLRGTKFQRYQTKFSMIVDAKHPIDKKIKGHLHLFIWSNGGWKPNFYHIYFPDPCNLLKDNAPKMFAKLVHDSNISATCPIGPGKILIKDQIVSLDEFAVPSGLTFNGKFKSILTFFRLKERVLCFESFFNLAPA